jgi:hypothetical protein
MSCRQLLLPARRIRNFPLIARASWGIEVTRTLALFLLLTLPAAAPAQKLPDPDTVAPTACPNAKRGTEAPRSALVLEMISVR